MTEPCLFQSSHDRPTVARLIASALRPSSSSSAAIGPAERRRLQLNPRAHLGEDRAEHRGLEARRDRHEAVGAQQQHRLVAECLCQRGSLLGAADDDVGRAERSRMSKTGTPAARNAAL